MVCRHFRCGTSYALLLPPANDDDDIVGVGECGCGCPHFRGISYSGIFISDERFDDDDRLRVSADDVVAAVVSISDEFELLGVIILLLLVAAYGRGTS